MINALLKGLQPREADVLRRRYGLGGCCSETLEHLAGEYGLTRERIRQVEKEALARLSELPVRAIRRSLDAHLALLWDAITRSRGVLLLPGLDGEMLLVDQETRLAIEIVYRSLVQWLGSFVFRTDKGWFTDLAVASNFTNMVSQVRRVHLAGLTQQPGPAGRRAL